MRGADFMILLVVPLAAAAVALLVRGTTIGTQISAVAANREAAELAGSPAPMAPRSPVRSEAVRRSPSAR